MIDSPEPKICDAEHPKLGFRCGLYATHREDGFPHRALKRDYPYSRSIKRLKQWQLDWEIMPGERVRRPSG